MRKIIVVFILIGAFSHPYLALGVESRKVTGRLSLGYDNLTLTQNESTISHSFSSIYLDSKLSLFPHRKRFGGIFRFQNGFKVISDEENIAFNQADLGLALLISPRFSSEIIGELKQKDIFPAEDSSVQGEYGYSYWHSGVSLKFNGEDFNCSIKYLYHQRNYKDKDFFDSKDHQVQLMTNYPLSCTLTVCLTGKVTTSRFSRQQEASLQELQELSLQEHHTDTLYEISLGSQWIDNFLINPSYAFQRNTSDYSEYSFYAHQFSIIAAIPLYWEVTLQCYGQLQFCRYESQGSSSPSPPDEDNNEQSHDVLVLSLSRDIFKRYSLEMRYLLSQTGTSSSSGKYRRQSCSLSMSYLF
ncbi:MAG: hypothetical protein AB1847_17650 [bacterium]